MVSVVAGVVVAVEEREGELTVVIAPVVADSGEVLDLTVSWLAAAGFNSAAIIRTAAATRSRAYRLYAMLIMMFSDP